MGKDGTYRWQRREGQKTRRDFQAFWGFELLLLFLVFFIGTVGIRIFLLQALNNSYCIEAVASYGGGEMFQSVFQAFFWLTIIAIAFWLAISIVFFKRIWKSKSAVFHGAQLLCLIILVGMFNALHIDDLDVPDGELPAKFLIVDLSDEEPQYFYRPDTYLKGEAINRYMYWSLGNPETGEVEYVTPSCVWADKSLITVPRGRHINGYGDLDETEHLKAWNEHQKSGMGWWPMRLGFSDLEYFIAAFYGPYTAVERLKDNQVYRPMTSHEIEQFKAKQACLDAAVLSKDMKACEFYWVFDREQFDWDHFDGPDLKLLEYRRD